MLVIVVQGKGEDPQRFEFDQHEVTIGRAEVNDIVLPVTNISKRHARIARTQAGLFLHDRHSTNGTYVNGRKLLGPLPIDENDRIHIGEFTLSVQELLGATAVSGSSGRVRSAPRPVPTADMSRDAHPGYLPRMPWLDEWISSSSMLRTDPVLESYGSPVPEDRSPSRASPDPAPSPTVIVSLPAVIREGETATLQVRTETRPDTRTDMGELRTSCALEIQLSFPDGGLSAPDGEDGVLRVSRSQRSPRLSFPLRARESGPARVEIAISHRGARLATLLLQPQVRPGTSEPASKEVLSAPLPVEALGPGLGPRHVLRIREEGVRAASLDRRTLRVELLHVPGEIAESLAEGTMGIEAPLKEVMRTLYGHPTFTGFAGLLQGEREEALRSLGADLSARLLPKGVREALDGLPDGTFLQVDCADPWVPFEALRIGQGVRAAYLGERFALCRGGLGTYSSRFARAPRLFICPPGAAASRREQQALAALDPRLCQVHRLDQVLPYLRDGGIAGWHISGQGGFERAQLAAAALQLEDGVFAPAQIAPATRFVRLHMRPPMLGAFVLVSVSEAEAPRDVLQPAGTAMWIDRLFAAGAGAVVATTWPVSVAKAGRFAEAFYRSWAAGRPLAVAAAEARESIREDGDPSWLSYAVFGLPGAHLSE
jgi:hypothetical protein